MTPEQTSDIDDRPDPRPAHGRPFVPAGFAPPSPPRMPAFWLEPLGPQHNEADHAAWSSSNAHSHGTPGYPDGSWPHEMTAAENLAGLQMHADHFARRLGFTYTVRSAADDDVIGCVYIYPSRDPKVDAEVQSWVRVSHADLDVDLWRTVSEWLDQWPFAAVDYAAR